MMHEKILVSQWIEMKLGKIISKDLKDKIVEESSVFDVENYVNHLLDTYFRDISEENLETDILTHTSISYPESDISTENESQDSFDLERKDYNSNLIEDITEITENTSEEFLCKYLEELEVSFQDLRLTNWNSVRKILQSLLERNMNQKTNFLVLKVFKKFLMCSNQPQIVCEAFISLTEVVSIYFDLINAEDEDVLFEEVYDLKEEKWFYIKTPTGNKNSLNKEPMPVDPETLVKSMWLLIECQKQMPEKWVRFNERRLREIIFSFIHLLSSTNTSELQDKLSGLEILSVLNPTARWCRHWCHTAIGRFLLCSALRKYRSFFIHVVEVILINMKVKKQSQLPTEIPLKKISSEKDLHPKNSVKINLSKSEKENQQDLILDRNKCIRSAPTMLVQKNSSRKKSRMKKKEHFFQLLLGNIPQTTVKKAVFLHCMSLVVCLLQHRSGRSLFPVHTTLKKRLLSVQDLTLSMIDYIDCNETKGGNLSSTEYNNEYRGKIVDLVNILKQHKSIIVSSTGSRTDRLPSSHW